jgi:hypothetical protein
MPTIVHIALYRRDQGDSLRDCRVRKHHITAQNAFFYSWFADLTDSGTAYDTPY